MPRFKGKDIDNYGGQGGSGFFSLKNDKDVAQVRFMYESEEDIEGFAVHSIEIDERRRNVNCLREYGQPKDVCPFCRENMPVRAKLFVPLYNIDEDKVQIWERGKKFKDKLFSICARYPNVVSHIFEIERNGKAGDMQTTYEIYEVDKDDVTLEDLPELPEILDGTVLDKSADDIEYFLQEGEFPPEEDDTPKTRRRRQHEEDEVEEDEDVEEERPKRSSTRRSAERNVSAGRTGTNSRRARKDKF